MADPSKNLRDEFLREIRRRMRDIRGLVREQVGYENDVFGLSQDTDQNHIGDDTDDSDPDVFRFQSRGKNIDAFMDWFISRLREGFFEPADIRAVENGEHWTAELIRLAYAQGWRQARNRLRQEGVSVGSLPGADGETDGQGLITALGTMPAPRRSLETLYRRTYENLQSIESDMTEVVRSELMAGLRDGINPREMARNITDEIESIQKTQAEVLARTETMHAYTESSLDRYRDAGINAVTQVEFLDSDDRRVCPVCSSLDGRVTPLSEIDTATFQFEPGDDEPDSLAGEYSVKVPTHPQCRCTHIPVID
jgi:SPP1 gp7 family putative phage head morphogenesis protein